MNRIVALLTVLIVALNVSLVCAEEEPLIIEQSPDILQPPFPSLLDFPGNVVRNIREATQVPRHMNRQEWGRFALGAGAVGILAVYDEDIRDNWKDRRDDFFDDFKPLGEGVNVMGFFLASYLTGWIAGHRGLAETGCAGIESFALMAIPTILVQNITGRERPDDGGSYDWFSFHDGHGASGHAAVAFTLCTVLDRRYSTIEPGMTKAQRFWRYTGKTLLYGAATCSALERINDDKHYATDVALGASIGFMSANFVMNRRPKIGIAAEGDRVSIFFSRTF